VSGGDFFSLFTRSAWRLETLPAYGTASSDPDFAAYLELGGLTPLGQRPRKQAWMAAVRAAVAEGRQLGRVYIARPPLSDYARYELATYPENADAGEDIRIVDLAAHPGLDELLAGLGPDFWLLDDERVLIMSYDPQGRFISWEETSDPSVVGGARRRRDLAIAASVSLQEYLASA
jgi:hypothetical protein